MIKYCEIYEPFFFLVSARPFLFAVCVEVEALRALLAAGADISNTDINGGSPVINTIYRTFFSLFSFCSFTLHLRA